MAICVTACASVALNEYSPLSPNTVLYGYPSRKIVFRPLAVFVLYPGASTTRYVCPLGLPSADSRQYATYCSFGFPFG